MIERTRGFEVVPERLFNDDPAEVPVAFSREACVAELLDGGPEQLRGRRQIEDDAAAGLALFVERFEALAQLAVGGRIFGIERHVVHAFEQPGQDGAVRLPACRLLQILSGTLPELLVAHLRSRHADDREPVGQEPSLAKVVERWNQLALREVARGAEDDEQTRRRWWTLAWRGTFRGRL